MSYIISCYTLFDITATGVLNRSRPMLDEEDASWIKKRNTQCNYDTILQLISLRSQPDVISKPELISINFNDFDKFGFLFEQQENEVYNCWHFKFEIQHASVFYDGISELGGLYTDCDAVPMLKVGTEWDKLPLMIDTSDELKNIYFEIVNEKN